MLCAVEYGSDFHLVVVAVDLIDHDVRQTCYHPLISSRCIPNVPHLWKAAELDGAFKNPIDR